MKIIPSLKRHRYVAIVSIVLVVVALVVGMVSWLSAHSYDLTIASTAGGSVTTPGEGPFTYDEGTVVSLVATADDGYQFVNWTSDVGDIADTDAAVTNITISGDYSVTAEFVKQYDLTISGTRGGLVTTPGEGTFTYAKGTVVNLVAEADTGYHFINWTGDVDTITDVNDATTTITLDDNYSITANFQYTTQVTAGGYHTVGLKSDGTLLAVGNNDDGQCNIGGWMDIIHVAAGYFHTVGLKNNGGVVAVGNNVLGQCNVGGWTGITQVAAGAAHTVGIKSDGTVVAVGNNVLGQCNVGGWTGITQVAAGDAHTVGLKSDGTVVAVGYNADGRCNVGGWTGINLSLIHI